MEETNAQGAGCTAVAGGERRERCETLYAGMVGVRSAHQDHRMRKWKKGRILKECSQHSERLRGEVSANRELCQQTSLLPGISAPQTTTAELSDM